MASNNQIYNRHISRISSLVARTSAKLHLKPHQLVTLAIFPIIILLGHVIHLFSPAEEVDNYFTDKRNLLNQVFVKKGWLWTTLAYLWSLFTQFKSSNANHSNYSQLSKSLLRYLLISVWWIFFTQWFFGFPIMDRIFLLSGGSCSNVPRLSIVKHGFSNGDDIGTDLFTVSSKTCRGIGGQWQGGHDPSGHIFLLSLSSLLLIFEYFKFGNKSTHFSRNLVQIWKDKNLRFVSKVIKSIRSDHFLTFVLVSFWLWMFLITSIYFHSFKEKVFGLVWCYLAVLVVYIVC